MRKKILETIIEVVISLFIVFLIGLAFFKY